MIGSRLDAVTRTPLQTGTCLFVAWRVAVAEAVAMDEVSVHIQACLGREKRAARLVLRANRSGQVQSLSCILRFPNTDYEREFFRNMTGQEQASATIWHTRSSSTGPGEGGHGSVDGQIRPGSFRKLGTSRRG